MVALWPSVAPNSSRPPERTQETRPAGGRPSKYIWDDFFIEVIRIANTPDGLPEKQSALEKHMMSWCQQHWAESIGESTVRERVRRIYRAIPKGAET